MVRLLTGGTLFQHRSWTGICIDQIHFIEHQGGLRATHAQVNRKPEHYSQTDDAVDIERIESLVRNLAQYNQSLVEQPTIVSALALASRPNYLGAPATVHALMMEFFDVTLGVIARERKYEECIAKQSELARIMTEDGTGYVRIPGWHTKDQLGWALIKRFDLDQEYCTDEDLHLIVSESLASISLAVRALYNLQLVDIDGPDLFPDRLAHLMAFVCSVYLGTHTLTSPDKTLKDFVPKVELAKLKSVLEDASDSGSRLPPFKFAELDLVPGTVLTFKLDTTVICSVAEANKVHFMGKEMSLSNAAIKALKAHGRNPKAARGPDYWCYQGLTLTAYRAQHSM
ncbi:hypothetical protein [Pseudomonas massiliensis]|uniref:hypothetical protein n=1 Tax=Pseudomonas massiliensis TaxID=522492 RepID=UPI000694B39E|nr:hypothetical protein [Pseudomonas massiliensis]